MFRAGQMNPSITILGGHVVVPSEVILLNSIVLPHKEHIFSHYLISSFHVRLVKSEWTELVR